MISEYVNKVLGNAKTILNVGAGAGSYEPTDRYVVAVEPSVVMLQQRLANNKIPAINAKGDNLPFDNKSFDATMAMVTIHHWRDMDKGLKELRRVTKGKVLDKKTSDARVVGVQRLNLYLSECKEVTSIVLQSVGVKDHDGMAVVVVN
jgi:ubiquinone/menaquinone biosynthesis C-methylase UbiE